jgi:predicted Zn-dependent protease
METRHRVLIALLAVFLTIPLLAERTKLKPGYNIFSVAQDIELGLMLSKEMEAQNELLRDSRINNYLDALGRRLAVKAAGGKQYRFQFKIMNDRSINAAGLPGGIVYVHSGTIAAASNEAQLAGVIAHEVAHVVLRHGTHQISNAYVLEAPVSSLGAIGSKSVTAILSRIGGGFAASSMVLRNSRQAEIEADLMGAQIVYDAGYDPKAAAAFYDKLEVESAVSHTAQNADDHPRPANRLAAVMKEIDRLGGVPPDAVVDSAESQAIRLLVSNSLLTGERPNP